MLKLIGKILVILLVCGILTGGIYLLVQNSAQTNSGLFAGRESHRAASGTPGQNGQNLPPEGFRERGGEGNFSLARGMAGVFGKMLQLAVITIIVLLIQGAVTKTPRKKPVSAG